MVVGVARAAARGIRNSNPGNIERQADVRWQGMAEDQSSDVRFVVFTAPKWGIRAICRVLITYQDKRQARDGSKIDTVAEIIDRWAPATENNTQAYVDHVAELVHVGADETIDVYQWHTMRPLVLAIIQHELGYQPYDDATLDAGLILAGLQPPASVVQPGKSRVAKYAGVAAGAVTTAGTTVLAVAPGVVASLPAAKASYDQTTAALAPVAEAVPWLWGVVIAAGVIAMVATVYLATRNRQLRERVQ